MAWRIYRSTDGGAPTITGEVGKLTTLLDDILTGPSFNGTGNCSTGAPCAGWIRSFSGTNKSVYRPGAAATARQYYRIDDNAPDGAAAFARLSGFETMSGVDTGTGEMRSLSPIVGTANYYFPKKSITADSTARPWIIAADDRTAWIFIDDGYGGVIRWKPFMLGAIYSYVANDAYNGMIVCRALGFAQGETAQPIFHNIMTGGVNENVSNGKEVVRMFRDYDGTPDPVSCGLVQHSLCGTTNNYAGFLTGTNPADGSLWLSQIPIVTDKSAVCLRGHLRGLWRFHTTINHYLDGDTFSGSGSLAGKTFQLLYSETSGSGQDLVLETSNTVTASS